MLCINDQIGYILNWMSLQKYLSGKQTTIIYYNYNQTAIYPNTVMYLPQLKWSIVFLVCSVSQVTAKADCVFVTYPTACW